MVTNPKYRGPTGPQNDNIVPEDIQYPNLDQIEAEKKRVKDLKKQKEIKKQEEKKEINENDLENKFNQLKTVNHNVQINRALKPGILPNDDVKHNILVDRSLKPHKIRDVNDGESKPAMKSILSKPTNKTTPHLESDLVVDNDITSLSLDRSLKPNILKELNVDNGRVKYDNDKGVDSAKDVTAISNSSSEV